LMTLSWGKIFVFEKIIADFIYILLCKLNYSLLKIIACIFNK
jgi:hypothetical protein